MSCERPSLSLTDRIKQGGEILEVAPREIAKELKKFAETEDAEGVKTMFDAYLNWELSDSPRGETPDQIRARALENFDVVARVADNLDITAQDDYSAMVMADQSLETIGKVTRFYRKAVDYNPQPPTKQLN